MVLSFFLKKANLVFSKQSDKEVIYKLDIGNSKYKFSIMSVGIFRATY